MQGSSTTLSTGSTGAPYLHLPKHCTQVPKENLNRISLLLLNSNFWVLYITPMQHNTLRGAAQVDKRKEACDLIQKLYPQLSWYGRSASDDWSRNASALILLFLLLWQPRQTLPMEDDDEMEKKNDEGQVAPVLLIITFCCTFSKKWFQNATKWSQSRALLW